MKQTAGVRERPFKTVPLPLIQEPEPLKNSSSYERKLVPVHGYGDVSAHQFHGTGNAHFEFTPDRIILICVREGKLQMNTKAVPHQLELHTGEALFLANPAEPWSLNWSTSGPMTAYMMNMEMGGFHRLLGADLHKSAPTVNVSFHDLMRRIAVSPSLMMGFESMTNHKLQPPYSKLYEQGKFLEQFSLIMDAAFGPTITSCPVALSPASEKKLHEVRRYIMQSIAEDPDPDFLALEFDLSRQTLREGFKFLFGKTLHQFHSDFKLEWAMQQLTEGDFLVKEVAFAVGYQNPSHFIAAFKKKFGFTPKQYLKREVVSH